MKTAAFAAGILTGFAGMTAAAYVMRQTMPGTELGKTVSRAAHGAADAADAIAHDAANAVDHIVR